MKKQFVVVLFCTVILISIGLALATVLKPSREATGVQNAAIKGVASNAIQLPLQHEQESIADDSLGTLSSDTAPDAESVRAWLIQAARSAKLPIQFQESLRTLSLEDSVLLYAGTLLDEAMIRVSLPSGDAELSWVQSLLLQESENPDNPVDARLRYTAALFRLGGQPSSSLVAWLSSYEELLANYIDENPGGYYEASVQEWWLKVLAFSDTAELQAILAKELPDTYRYTTLAVLKALSTKQEMILPVIEAVSTIANDVRREPDERLQAIELLMLSDQIPSDELGLVLESLQEDIIEDYGNSDDNIYLNAAKSLERKLSAL